MIRLAPTPIEHSPRRLGLSWSWSWVGRAGTNETIGLALATPKRMLLLCWRRP